MVLIWGGTSTDVSHYAGAFERTFDTKIAGVRVQTPVMKIHTVAAGGGSVLYYDGARFRVGPGSAGANPGPASYGKNGPLTLTDANIMLGRIQPKYFPNVFGLNGKKPLDLEVVRDKFKSLAVKVGSSSENIAQGFLEVATQNMANAIKQISVQRGYNITGYTLVCFGGAGGQHACGVADVLGMDTILVHPLAGVLSAYGIGIAELRAMRERSVEQELSTKNLLNIRLFFDSLTNEVIRELKDQGVSESEISTQEKLYIRYSGTDTTLEIPNGELSDIRAAFESSHRQRFGFDNPDYKLIVESIAVEANGASNNSEDPELTISKNLEPDVLEELPVVFSSNSLVTPIYDRSTLLPGHLVHGPAIIIEVNGTTVIDPGWRAEITKLGHLIARRIELRSQDFAIGTKVDPVMLEVFNNLFMSIAEQMGSILANTASSVNIKERLDFSCAIFDIDGGLIANAPHMPVHLGSMGESVRAIISARGDSIRSGDVYALNAPYNGGTHLPDVTVITPIFDNLEETLLFFVGSRGHQADIGGITPGSMPPNSKEC